ncbi:phage tail tape measure protein [Methylocystis sp. JAN1]|uniref:phage tail tape measure protein n=1 Tax=Methylocystis sp. JAN1 TaxID=3397211 RepID=UPI003FA336AC
MDNGDNFPDVFNQPSASAPLAMHDLASMKQLLDQINASGEKATRTLMTGFGAAASSGKNFNETLAALSQSLARLALRDATRSLTEGLVSGLSGVFANAFGGDQPVTPFAEGGVIASPAYFANGGAMGLMGERGAEAIMPLARGSDGRLGVVAQGGETRPVSVTVNIAAQDVDSFRRSEAQITGALARAVARGQRNL